ncbi:hypothetical protein KEM48_004086 [Puccinia striiformis f. sp. tritici PST-130]|nr:hypothetical protein KEM48_004086 [Puccinia striiformis f. sp. tritici PST-130]
MEHSPFVPLTNRPTCFTLIAQRRISRSMASGHTEEEAEVCRAFNLPSKCALTASYISQHQDSVGVAGVSEKYGKRSWARYPVLWTLKSIDPLPNPDPTDVESLDIKPPDMKTIQIDQEAEAKRPGKNCSCKSGLVWSKIPKHKSRFDSGCVPSPSGKTEGCPTHSDRTVIDLYGQLAALKLERLMEMYPGRVYSKPEFTALPSFVFSGGDFALIPVGTNLLDWWQWNSGAKTLKAALESPEQERAILRARSVHQRFPVLEWRIRMETIHSRSVRASRKYAGRLAFNADQTEAIKPVDESPASHEPGMGLKNPLLLPTPASLDQTHRPSPDGSRILASSNKLAVQLSEAVKRLFITKKNGLSHSTQQSERRTPNTPVDDSNKNGNADERNLADFQRTFSRENDKNSPLNQAVKDFTDEDGRASLQFVCQLRKLNALNSQSELCIARYILAAHKSHFNEVRKGTLALAKTKFSSSPTLSVTSIMPRSMLRGGINSHAGNVQADPQAKNEKSGALDVTTALQMNLWQIRLQKRVFGWPIYTILLAAGQVLGATSFQLSLLSGTSSNGSFDFYVIGAVNILGSISWYWLSRRKPATWSLSMPWIFFGLAFVFIGLPSLSENLKQYFRRHPLAVAASGFYSFASSAGFLFFSSNFGEEAGGTTDAWVRRACIVQGTQQVWVGALCTPGWINAITLTLGAGCFFIAYILFTGLPKYYRNVPGTVPNFTRALFRRKLVLWYLAAEILRNYWLSGPYGRNWNFLWTRETSFGVTLFLLLFFFVGVWGVTIWGLSVASKSHTWLVAIFAIGLGAPRWCQMLWGTSSVASYFSWGGAAGPHIATSLWLWLGVLDAVQGVGLGMILLQTLSRVHVAATLCLAQIIGSTAVLVARATAPNRIGPGGVFPDLALWSPKFSYLDSPLANWQFWIALICQLIIVAGYFVLFRREQLSKP